jgi:uncharacterized protein
MKCYIVDHMPTRWIYLSIGWVCFVVACITLPIPLAPTTPFILIAAWAFSKSSPRFDRWLREHRWFGPTVRGFRAHRVIPLPMKLVSAGTLVGMVVVSIVSGMVGVWALVPQTLLAAGGLWFLASCPSVAPEPEA